MFFSAVVVSSLVLAPLSDKIGRKKVVIFGILLQLFASSCLLFSTSLNLTYWLVFMMGFAMPPRVFVAYVYAMEFMPIKNTPNVTAICLGLDGMTLCFASFYFMLLDKEWKDLYFLSIVVTVAATVLTAFMPESPRYLIGKRQFDEARSVLGKMGRINKVKPVARSHSNAFDT